MSERKEGWYFVQITPRVSGDDDGWEAVKYEGGLWFMAGRADYLPEGLIATVGPRIPTPDEPWKCVPKELDEAMSEAFEESFADQGWHPDIGGEIDKQDIWDAQLDAAPKPGDV